MGSIPVVCLESEMKTIVKHEVGPTIDTAELTRLVDSFGFDRIGYKYNS
jgi:hypothetical protein